jgi:hypothetical protein
MVVGPCSGHTAFISPPESHGLPGYIVHAALQFGTAKLRIDHGKTTETPAAGLTGTLSLVGVVPPSSTTTGRCCFWSAPGS